ncbi:uncharacterized protein Dana_GF26747, isoform A [Drosophila ananassae]|uniref:Uncharacterized protein, isoform A n=1 Tax=Drosophila ananassae TaxID=7217 RepID=A0A0P9CFI3_DROAN|nr:uncharacterized protein Dana_GF26747, isoform A [Drosophila ananassae]
MDKLKPSFANLLENQKFSDCHILVGNESFNCHKLILSSASEFYERMFLSDFQESKTAEFRLNDVSPDTLRVFLDYVYTYNFEKLKTNPNEMILNLFECGSKWLVESITADCEAVLKERAPQMSIGNLVETFQVAHNAEHKAIIKTVTFHLRRLAGGMKCYDSLFLTSDAFEEYIRICDDKIPEEDRFKMIEAYVTINGLIDVETADSGVNGTILDEFKILKDDDKPGSSKEISVVENKAAVSLPDKNCIESSAGDNKDIKLKKLHLTYVKTLLNYIHFEQMGKTTFYNVVGKSRLLTYEEKFEKMFLTK